MPLISTLASSSARGFGGLRTFGPAELGAFHSIASNTVVGSSTNSIAFTGISQEYAHLQIRFYCPTIPNELRLRFNSDSGANYTRVGIYADTGGQGSFRDSTATYADMNVDCSTTGTGIFDILDYTTSKYKQTRGIAGRSANGHYTIAFRGTTWNSTSAITSMTFDHSSGNFDNGSLIALYGIKGA